MLCIVEVAPVESQEYRLGLGLFTEISRLEKRMRSQPDRVKQKQTFDVLGFRFGNC